MQNKNRSYQADRGLAERKRRRMIRNWVIVVLVLVLGLIGIRLLSHVGETTEMTAVPLSAAADQSVTPFGADLLYYDQASIHCLASNGALRWSFPVGSGARFSVSDTHLVIWVGSQVYIVDHNGRPSYNEAMQGEVRFARVGARYAAIIVGEETAPTLIVKDLQGGQVDEETEAFSNLMMMDVGFYGDSDQYLWTLALDVYGTGINTVMNTFQVGKMNTGEVSISDRLAYKVLFANNRLRVFTTQQLFSYDYKAVMDTNNTLLIYGWEAVDAHIPDRGEANILLVPTGQSGSMTSISQLRVLTGEEDRRYTLPTSCIGAMVDGQSVYAFSTDYIYRSDLRNQRFYAYDMPLPADTQATAYLGTTDDGHALLAAGNTVYSVSLPKR